MSRRRGVVELDGGKAAKTDGGRSRGAKGDEAGLLAKPVAKARRKQSSGPMEGAPIYLRHRGRAECRLYYAPWGKFLNGTPCPGRHLDDDATLYGFSMPDAQAGVTYHGPGKGPAVSAEIEMLSLPPVSQGMRHEASNYAGRPRPRVDGSGANEDAFRPRQGQRAASEVPAQRFGTSGTSVLAGRQEDQCVIRAISDTRFGSRSSFSWGHGENLAHTAGVCLAPGDPPLAQPVSQKRGTNNRVPDSLGPS